MIINKLKRFFKENIELLLCITISVVIVFSAYLLFGHSYLLNNSNDHIFQINQFYTEYIRMINEAISARTPIFYSWNSLLGNNFFAAKAYYCTGDLLLLISTLLFRNINAVSFILFETIFCVYFGAISFNYYLKEIGIKQKHIRIIGSIVFSLGGNAVLYFQYPMFLRFYVVIPLIFLGVERYLKENKTLLFIIAISLALLQNYYLAVPLTSFLPVYFLLSSYLKDEGKTFNLIVYIKRSIKLVFSYCIGVLNTCVLILPAFCFLIGNNRLTYNELQGLITWPIKTWLSLFYYLLIPINTVFNNQPFMVNLNTEAPAVSNYYSIYVSVIGVIGLVSFFFNKEIKKKKAYLIMLAILVFVNVFLPLNSLIHMGTTPTMRFTYILGFFLLVLSLKGLDGLSKKESIKSFKVVASIYLIVLIITYLTKSLTINDINVVIVVLTSLLLGFVSSFLIDKKVVLVALTMIEVITYSTYYVSFTTFKEYKDHLNSEIFEYYKQMDEDKLYRIAIDSRIIEPLGAEDLNLNYPLVYNYMGLSTYDTTYEYGVEELINEVDAKVANNIISFNKPELYKLLSVKYVAVEDESELDNINEYEFAYKLNHLFVYKLDGYNNLGHTYTKFIDNFDDVLDLNDTLVVDNNLLNELSDIKEASKEQLKNIDQLSSNNFNGEIYLDSKQVLLITIPYDKGWTIRDNGEVIKAYSVDGGLIGLVLNEGYHQIEAYFMPKGFKPGFVMSSIGLILTAVVAVIENKNKSKKIRR